MLPNQQTITPQNLKPNIQINYCANTLQLVNFLKEEGLIRGATIITKPKKLKILVYLKYNSTGDI